MFNIKDKNCFLFTSLNHSCTLKHQHKPFRETESEVHTCSVEETRSADRRALLESSVQAFYSPAASCDQSRWEEQRWAVVRRCWRLNADLKRGFINTLILHLWRFSVLQVSFCSPGSFWCFSSEEATQRSCEASSGSESWDTGMRFPL